MSGSQLEVVIDGPPDQVFDVVTIAGLWPQWHALSRAVAGVTERPFQLGDRIYEFIRTPAGPAELDYQVVECDRSRRARMQAEDGTIVTYTFDSRGDITVFRRRVGPGPPPGPQRPP